jgi:hypothetical protein
MSVSGSNVRGDAVRRRGVGHRARFRGVVAVAAALVTLVAVGGAAEAKPNHPPGQSLLADGLAGPLSIDVGDHGEVLVGQAFSGTVSTVSRRGTVTDLFNDPGATAVADGPFGIVIYSVTDDAGSSTLKLRWPWGTTTVLADLGAFEAANNPDSSSVYGITDLAPECAAQWPEAELGPVTYPGQVDAHPYALALGDWGVYVADAGANAILHVDWRGTIRVVSVLAPQPVEIPADPTGFGLPACVGGHTYNFEPVPTDIELSGRSGYVSLLPGGPEDASLGARGSVVKVDLRSGGVTPVADGFAGATDLALSPRGDLYVAELFGGKVTKVSRGGARSTVAELPDPAAVEWSEGRLYVAWDVFASGKVGTIPG